MTGENVEVRPSASGEPDSKGVFAARDFAVGERIGTFAGTETAKRTRMSLQFGPERHIEPGDTDPLRFLNHACHPNAAFTGRELFARRAIPTGNEVTIDYTCHESELASPFTCRCGSEECLGLVAGWGRLNPAQRLRRRDRVSRWLSPP